MSIEQEKGCLEQLHSKIIKYCAEKVSQSEINALMNAQFRIDGQKPKYNKIAKVFYCPLCERKVIPNYDLFCSGCGHKLDYSELTNQGYNELNDLNTMTRIFEECGYEDISDYRDVMSLAEFIDEVNCGGFIDYDGYGELVIDDKIVKNTETYIKEKSFKVDNLYFSFKDVLSNFWNRAKVVWYNK